LLAAMSACASDELEQYCGRDTENMVGMVEALRGLVRA
jgi:hypothetical protein